MSDYQIRGDNGATGHMPFDAKGQKSLYNQDPRLPPLVEQIKTLFGMETLPPSNAHLRDAAGTTYSLFSERTGKAREITTTEQLSLDSLLNRD